MNAFSQLNGQTSLPRGGQVRLSVDSSGAAFSQLNGFDFSERATQKTHSSQARAFSQLNARAVGGRATHVTKHSTSGAARRGRVFSQINAKGVIPLSQARKPASARAAFSQLNALGLVASSTCCSAPRSRPKPAPRRPDFRGLKPRAYLHTVHEPRTTRGSVHLESGIWRNRMK